MKVVRDDLWLCVDCLFAAVNGDVSGIDCGSEEETDARIAEVNAGLERLGPGLVADIDSNTGDGIREFDNWGCACCKSGLGGASHRFAILGE